jgi:hypothetical protein
MNTTTNTQDHLEDFAISLIGMLGQVRDLKTEVTHCKRLLEEERKKREDIQRRAQAFMQIFDCQAVTNLE